MRIYLFSGGTPIDFTNDIPDLGDMSAPETLYDELMTGRKTQLDDRPKPEVEIRTRDAALNAPEESFALLESWSELHVHPEFWPDVCRKWADRVDDDDAMKRLKPLLNSLFSYAAESDGHSIEIFREKMRRTIDNAGKGMFFVDRRGVIQSIGKDAAEILGFTVGESIKELLLEPLPHLFQQVEQSSKGSLSEVFGRDGVRRLININRSSGHSGKEEKIRISICNVFLPAAAESYLRKKLSLTDTEIEILSLSIQRHNIEGIANKRNNSVSTIRSHIKNITSKFGCKSFNDVLARTLEVIAYHQKDRPSALDEISDNYPTRRGSRIRKLQANNGQIEYAIYGDPKLRPILMLHSLEFGHKPSEEFISHATKSGYCIYAPLRPGFGLSSTGNSVEADAELLKEFLASFRLEEVIVLSFHSAAPTAMHLARATARISQIIIVNYAFNAADKIRNIKPRWLKGLHDFALASRANFNFSFRLMKGMIGTLGPKKFYETVYDGCTDDLAYLRQHMDQFELAAELILSADRETVQHDVVGVLKYNPIFDEDLVSEKNIIGLVGEHTYGVPPDAARDEARRLNIPFFVIENAGINCVFQKPNDFFKILNSVQEQQAQQDI